jgi:hypothetical protein
MTASRSLGLPNTKQKVNLNRIILANITFVLHFFLGLTSSACRCRCRRLLLYLITLSDTHILGATPLDEGSARCRELYVTTHNTHVIQTDTPQAGSQLAVPASQRRQTYAFGRAANGIGIIMIL